MIIYVFKTNAADSSHIFFFRNHGILEMLFYKTGGKRTGKFRIVLIRIHFAVRRLYARRTVIIVVFDVDIFIRYVIYTRIVHKPYIKRPERYAYNGTAGKHHVGNFVGIRLRTYLQPLAPITATLKP